MIGGSMSGRLAVAAALMMAASMPGAGGAEPHPGFGFGGRYQKASSRSYYGNSRRRKIPPAGTKLARKAAKGLIGVRKGW